MRIQNIEWKDFSLAHGRQCCAWVGSELPGCKQYLVPVRIPENVETLEDAWVIRPSQNSRPILQANVKPSSGWIFRLSSFSGASKVYGRIYAVNGLDSLTLISYGIGGLADGSRWDEAIIQSNGPATLVIFYTGGETKMAQIDSLGVTLTDVCDFEAKRTIHIHDPRVKRWSAYKNGGNKDNETK